MCVGEIVRCGGDLKTKKTRGITRTKTDACDNLENVCVTMLVRGIDTTKPKGVGGFLDLWWCDAMREIAHNDRTVFLLACVGS